LLQNGSDPVWNTPAIFSNNLPQKGSVVFRVKSKKGVQTNYLGEATLPFDFAMSGSGRLECWLPLHASKGTKQDRFGSIRVTLSLFQSNSPTNSNGGSQDLEVDSDHGEGDDGALSDS